MPDGAPVTPGAGLGVLSDEVPVALTGTVSKNGTTTVTGSSSTFLSELSSGQVIRIPGGGGTEDRIVDAIASDTSLTVTAAFANTASGQTASKVLHAQVIQQQRPTTSSVTSTNVDTSSAVTLKAANVNRTGLLIWNAGGGVLYVKFGSSASTTDFTVQIAANQLYEIPAPVYTGIVTGIWAAGSSGSGKVTELTLA